MDDVEQDREIALPALMRAARAVYGRSIREALASAGHEDLPPNGPFVLGAIARTGAPLSQVIDALHVSKQAAGQLVDTLVARGYLERTVDPEDRRRLVVHLTERGVAAAEASHEAVEQVDRRLVEAVGADVVDATRRGLVALVDLDER